MVTGLLSVLLALALHEAADRQVTSILDQINLYRKAGGLKPVELDAALSRGCQAHAQYLAKYLDPTTMQNINVHDEDAHRAGYSKEGLIAAQKSAIHFIFGDASPAESVNDFFAMFYHRMALARTDLKRVGIGLVKFKGNRCWIVVNTKSGVSEGGKEFTQPAFYPADGQNDVPIAFGGREFPNPIPAEGRNRKPGFPITVMFPERNRVKEVAATLKDPSGKEVPVWLSTPERPALASAHQYNAICLIPRDRLRADSRYMVTVTAKVDGKEWQRKWGFRTAAK